jgi:hypothetical protein
MPSQIRIKMMALQPGALRTALIAAGASTEKADRASEEVAGYENLPASLEGKVNLMTWSSGLIQS